MTDTPAAPDAAPAPTGDPAPAAPPTPTDSGKAPTWDGDFDPSRAAKLVENLRDDVKKRDAEIAALKAATAKGASASKSAEERLAALESRAAQAERSLLVAQAAKKHGIPDDLVPFLSESSAEALDAQAEALAKYAKKPAEDVPGRPRPALKPGAGAPSDAEPFDPAKVAAAVRKRRS